MRRRKLLIVLGLVVILLVAAALKLSPLGPGPALPAGATRLHIANEPAHLLPTFACETAALVPSRIEAVNDELHLVSVADGTTIQVVWPTGWAAWQIGGQAELVGRDGSVVAREGDVLSDFGGGVGADDVFHVCIIGG